DVLKWNIDVTRDLVAAGDGFYQLIAPMGRMGVKQAHPKFAFDHLNFAKQFGECRSPRGIDWLARAGFFRPQIHPVIGRVLADQIDLAHSFSHQSANLSDDRLDVATTMPAAHLWYDAEAARMIAALGDFYISRVRRRQPKPGCVVIGNI